MPLSRQLEYIPFGLKNQWGNYKMIMNFLDTLELIERKHGIVGTIIGIALILLITVIAIAAINTVLQVWFHSLNEILIKFFDIRLY